jgi:hypothetical protein
MIILIQLLAVLLMFAGIFIIVRPVQCLSYLQMHLHTRWLYALAIGLRLIVGLVLIILASRSRFPVALGILGWISVLAAITFAITGHQRFVRLLRWAVSRWSGYLRAGGTIALVLGAFLFYAFS